MVRVIQRVRYRYESWLVGWATLADGLATVFTFGYWWPNWSLSVTCWAEKRSMKRSIIR